MPSAASCSVDLLSPSSRVISKWGSVLPTWVPTDISVLDAVDSDDGGVVAAAVVAGSPAPALHPRPKANRIGIPQARLRNAARRSLAVLTKALFNSDYPLSRLFIKGVPATWPGRPSVFLVETGESRTPRPESFQLECATGLSSICFSLLRGLTGRDPLEASRWFLGSLAPAFERAAPRLNGAHSQPSRRGGDERGSLVRRPVRLYFRQLFFAALFTRLTAPRPAIPRDHPLSRPRVPIRFISGLYHDSCHNSQGLQASGRLLIRSHLPAHPMGHSPARHRLSHERRCERLVQPPFPALCL